MDALVPMEKEAHYLDRRLAFGASVVQLVIVLRESKFMSPVRGLGMGQARCNRQIGETLVNAKRQQAEAVGLHRL